jgi:hypothetical protein
MSTTTATHTPGPWTYDFTDAHGNHYGGFSVEVNGAVICGRAGWPSRAEESLANARLIAAAPELLEAAKHAAMEWRLHGQLTDSCRVLERAIAKAEGSARLDGEAQP